MVLKVFRRSRMALCRRSYADSFGCRDADDVVDLRFFLFPLVDQFPRCNSDSVFSISRPLE